MGVGRGRDLLDDYLKRDGLVDRLSKVEVLRDYVNRKDTFGVSPIHIAANHGDFHMIKLLCANEGDPFIKTSDGLTVIHSAAEGDQVNVIYYFIKHYNMDIDVRDNKKCTALHWAVIEGNEIGKLT